MKRTCVQKVMNDRIAITNKVATEKRMLVGGKSPAKADSGDKRPNLVAQQIKDSNVSEIF